MLATCIITVTRYVTSCVTKRVTVSSDAIAQVQRRSWTSDEPTTMRTDITYCIHFSPTHPVGQFIPGATPSSLEKEVQRGRPFHQDGSA